MQEELSRRERQIMDAIYARGEATASDVLDGINDPPTRTAVRTMLRILVEKGHLKYRKEGREFMYKPTAPRKRVGQSAFKRVVQTFFGGSLGDAVAAHLSEPGAELSDDEIQKLSALIDEAKKRGE